MNYKSLQIHKSKWWQEIKSLEQEYKRNLQQIKLLNQRQSDISFEVQKRIDKINKETEKFDNENAKRKESIQKGD